MKGSFRLPKAMVTIMKLKIGEKIRALREQQNMTQEQLAAAMSITSQAISRWERGEGYPDIELLPSIANFFHTSVDFLLGFDYEREERLNRILSDAANSDTSNAISLLKNAAEEFPSEPRILLLLMRKMAEYQSQTDAVKLTGDGETLEYDCAANQNTALITDSIQLLKRLLHLDLSPDDRAEVLLRLITLCAAIGDTESAVNYAIQESPSGGSREFLLTFAYPLSSKNNRIVTANAALGFLRMCKLTVMQSLRTQEHTYALSVLNAAIAFYHSIFPEGICGPANCDLMHLYMRCANLYEKSGQPAKAEECVREAYQNAQIYKDLKQAGAFSYPKGIAEDIVIPRLPEAINVTFEELFAKLPIELQTRCRVYLER